MVTTYANSTAHNSTPPAPRTLIGYARPQLPPCRPEAGGPHRASNLLRGLRHLFQVGRIAQMHRRIQLERVLETQLLADFAHCRHDFLA